MLKAESTVIATGLKNDRADIGSFSTVAEQARKILTVGWSLGPHDIKRRLHYRFPSCSWLLVSLLPADYLPEGNRNLILWLTEPSQEPVFQKQ